MDRRNFLKLSGAASLPLFAPRLVFGRQKALSDRDVLVCVYQRGGADGLNLIVPHAESAYYVQRGAVAVPEPGSTGGAIDLDGFFGLHPSLSPLAEIFQDGDLAMVHAVGSPDDSRSHFDAQDYMERGFPGSETPVYDGWLNRHLATLGPAQESAFRAVGFGGSLQLSLRGEVPAVGLAALAGYDLVTPQAESAGMSKAIRNLYSGEGSLSQVGQGVLASVDELKAAGAVDLPVENGAVYPQTSFGDQLADIARLIKADVGLEVACVDIGGWDHHDDEVDRMAPLADELARGLQAFYADLDDLMGSVTVVTMTEFGRRLQSNASGGTDHGHASVMMAMGQGVNGGQVLGEWPGLSALELNRGDLEVTTDFRTVLSEVLIQRLGNGDLEGIFPEFTGSSSLGLFAPRVIA